jgi:hypothetical protein
LKVLVKVNHDGKYVVDLDKDIDVNKCTPNTRVALRSDSYTLHKILPTKVDPLVSLMKVKINHYIVLLCSPVISSHLFHSLLLPSTGRESARLYL